MIHEPCHGKSCLLRLTASSTGHFCNRAIFWRYMKTLVMSILCCTRSDKDRPEHMSCTWRCQSYDLCHCHTQRRILLYDTNYKIILCCLQRLCGNEVYAMNVCSQCHAKRRPRLPIRLLVLHRQRSLGALSHDKAHMGLLSWLLPGLVNSLAYLPD